MSLLLSLALSILDVPPSSLLFLADHAASRSTRPKVLKVCLFQGPTGVMAACMCTRQGRFGKAIAAASVQLSSSLSGHFEGLSLLLGGTFRSRNEEPESQVSTMTVGKLGPDGASFTMLSLKLPSWLAARWVTRSFLCPAQPLRRPQSESHRRRSALCPRFFAFKQARTHAGYFGDWALSLS